MTMTSFFVDFMQDQRLFSPNASHLKETYMNAAQHRMVNTNLMLILLVSLEENGTFPWHRGLSPRR